MVSLDELKAEALEMPIDIQWERLESKDARDEFERVSHTVMNFLPELEYLYNKMSAGESVTFPGKDSPLKWEDREMLMERLQEELVAGYQLMDTFLRYRSVQTIVEGTLNA